MFCRTAIRQLLPAARAGTRWYVDQTGATIDARLKSDLKAAMRAKEKSRLTVIKGVLSDILYAEKGATTGASFSRDSDDDVAAVIQRAIKQRRESIQSYSEGGRSDLAVAEEAEVVILSGYLPQQLTGEEIETLVAQTIERLGVSGVKAMGVVMREVGIGSAQAPRSMVADAAKRLLGGP
ncbi:hypothetical protein GGI04_000281 [Coemansia thaxteri]|uniref:Altered inheritance of mitochondria protein 41 n=1 Tax=Coemansia thaxteri TaxID=2663907 RepID=A0A9W8EFZ0_9FUNG|nr:hypothetical protein H4R26_005308 [Coemansia thaxteri]KAJ2009629.1 hypothetical protein GGI04_000281 [Coemansia thaxteri]KAJ2465395.1 hypothetical protein EV174_006667 [Coemansia sp. RSA 2320]KAJ2474250.1 hypothetical protein GGI02_000226 [Coemansia sp. RSA 2322]